MTCRSPSGVCDQYMCVMYDDCPYPKDNKPSADPAVCEHDYKLVGAPEAYPWMSELVHLRCTKCCMSLPT